MINFDAKVYDGDTLIAESEGMYVVFLRYYGRYWY